MKPRDQGDWGERQAIIWLLEQGAYVFSPIGHSPDFDLVAMFPDRLSRVEVKTSRVHRSGRWEVQLCTNGGNQSWSGLVKRFTPSRCDDLFVAVADGRRWFIPSTAVDGRNQLLVGGPKYAAHEVQRGAPMPAWGASVSTLEGR